MTYIPLMEDSLGGHHCLPKGDQRAKANSEAVGRKESDIEPTMVQEGKKSVDGRECTQVTPVQNHDVKGGLGFRKAVNILAEDSPPQTHLSSVGNQEMLISLNRDC